MKNYPQELQDKFHKTFNVPANYFLSKLAMVGILDFDIIEFDKWYQKKYGKYAEDNKTSLKMAIEKRFGKDAVILIERLIKVS